MLLAATEFLSRLPILPLRQHWFPHSLVLPFHPIAFISAKLASRGRYGLSHMLSNALKRRRSLALLGQFCRLRAVMSRVAAYGKTFSRLRFPNWSRGSQVRERGTQMDDFTGGARAMME